LFDFVGHQVIRDPHFGDWGLQMGLASAELERRHPAGPYFDPDLTRPSPEESPRTLDALQEIYPAAPARAGEAAEPAAGARRPRPWPYFDPDFPGAYPEESPVTLDDLQEIYPVASARAKEDAEFAEAARRAAVELQRKRPGYLALWQHMRAVSMEDQRANF